MNVLGVDVGTTGLKMGVFSDTGGALEPVRLFSRNYEIHTYNNGLFSDIDPERWWAAFLEGCREMGGELAGVDVIALSGTTPGMTAMDAKGDPVHPAILMLDQRSRDQARRIVDGVGLDELMSVTGNMPVAGGCSLASILWIRDNHPDVFRRTHVFGHSNTFMAARMTGSFAIDPSSASLTALYNTAANDYAWNRDIARAFDLDTARLPEVIPSDGSAGRLKPALARDLGMRREPPVVIGGNDAVLAAYSVGITEPGDVINVNGTCEITLVCLPRCIPSKTYNVRCHVAPDRWLTLYVMNAGGKAYEWFRGLFCGDMDEDTYYTDFLPGAVDTWLDRETTVSYVPFLMGSRYSQEPLTAGFSGLTPGTTREQMLAAMVRGLCGYQKAHLAEIAGHVTLREPIRVTGRAVNDAIMRAKERWMWPCTYVYEEQSSLRGAALIGQRHLEQADL